MLDMEQAAGTDPVFPVWKTGVLTIELHLRGLSGQIRTDNLLTPNQERFHCATPRDGATTQNRTGTYCLRNNRSTIKL